MKYASLLIFSCIFAGLPSVSAFAQEKSLYEEVAPMRQTTPAKEVKNKKQVMQDTWRAWYADMSEEKQTTARSILEKSEPQIRTLQKNIKTTMQQLHALSYDAYSDPQTLLYLGRELQKYREDLREKLQTLNVELLRSIGRTLPTPPGRGCSAVLQASSPNTIIDPVGSTVISIE